MRSPKNYFNLVKQTSIMWKIITNYSSLSNPNITLQPSSSLCFDCFDAHFLGFLKTGSLWCNAIYQVQHKLHRNIHFSTRWNAYRNSQSTDLGDGFRIKLVKDKKLVWWATYAIMGACNPTWAAVAALRISLFQMSLFFYKYILERKNKTHYY